jgi:hypothetical protein
LFLVHIGNHLDPCMRMPMGPKPRLRRGSLVGEMKQLHRLAERLDNPAGSRWRNADHRKAKVAVEVMRPVDDENNDAIAGEIALVQSDGRVLA